MFPLFASLNDIYIYMCVCVCVGVCVCVCVCIGVSNLLAREVVEWKGMGVATVPVTEMNSYTKPDVLA